MAFQLDTAQVVTIGSEAGEPLATGGTYTGAGIAVVNASPVAVTAGVTYALVAPVDVGAIGDTVAWKIGMASGADAWTETDGHGKDGLQRATDDITGAGVSVREWTPQLTGNATFSIIRTGNPTITAPWIAPREGALIVAGAPRGARVEVASDGLHAYDETGTETARIDGGEGVFVGGQFRTSDALPGQVTLSDTANQGAPGIAVEPDDSTGYDVLPSIGPGPDHMSISGGVSTEGALAGAQFSANGTNIYHNGPGANGTGSWATVGDGEAGLTYRPDRTNVGHESAIRARADDAVVYSEGSNGSGFISAAPGSAYLAHVGPGDAMARSESRARATPEYLMLERKIPGVSERHRLVLDDDGVWVQTVFGANPVSYNLLPTVTTSPFTMPTGWEPDGANVAKYTITGSVCWWAGVVKSTGTVASGWTTLGYAPEDAWPKEGDQLRTLPTTSGRTVLGKISASNGRIEIWIDQAASGIFMHFSPFTYLV